MSKLYFYNSAIKFDSLANLLETANRFVSDSLYEMYQPHEVGLTRVEFSYNGGLPGLLNKDLIQALNFDVIGRLDPKNPFTDLESVISKASDLGGIGNTPRHKHLKMVAGNFTTTIGFLDKAPLTPNEGYSLSTSFNHGWEMLILGQPGSRFYGDPLQVAEFVRSIQEVTGVFKDKSIEEHLKLIQNIGISTVLPDEITAEHLMRIQKKIIDVFAEKIVGADWMVSNVDIESARKSAIDTYNQIIIRQVPARKFDLTIKYAITRWEGMECIRQLTTSKDLVWIEMGAWQNRTNIKKNAGVLAVTITPEGYRLGIGAAWPLKTSVLRESFKPETLALFSDIQIDFTTVHLGKPYSKPNPANS